MAEAARAVSRTARAVEGNRVVPRQETAAQAEPRRAEAPLEPQGDKVART